MITEIIENIDLNSNGLWFHGHIYATDDPKLIWSPASSPLHDCKPERSYVYSFLKPFEIIITSNKIRFKIENQRRLIPFTGLLSVRRTESEKERKKGIAKLLIQTIENDTLLRGECSNINRISSLLPKIEEQEKKDKLALIYFYQDTTLINQLYEKTPEGDIIEIVREAGAKIGTKGSAEFGNDLISKLSFELSTEVSEKEIVKTKASNSTQIAKLTLYLAAYGHAQDIKTFDLRTIPQYLFFDSTFEFDWSEFIDNSKKNELVCNIGPIKALMKIDTKNIIHEAIFDQLKQINKPKLQGLSKCDLNSDRSLNLIPVYLAT